MCEKLIFRFWWFWEHVCMFFISHTLSQRGRACFLFRAAWSRGAVHVFFSRSLVQRGSACFFFSHTSGPRGRACFFFAFWALCEKLIFRTTNILTFGDFFLARILCHGDRACFFFAHPGPRRPCMFFFAPTCQKSIVRTFRFSR